MKPVISLKDLQEMLRSGKELRALPADALLTPSARDFLRDLEGHHRSPDRAAEVAGARFSLSHPMGEGRGEGDVTSQSSPAQIESFFNSPRLQGLKEQICDIGRRMWQRAYVDGNGGNIAIRAGPDLALCTPTLVSKGFMKPEDLCLVDLEGNQFCSGNGKQRTSEILMHLQILKRQPRAVATVHCHPPYSTGFAVAGVQPPTCMIPEFEVFSSVAIAPYRTPGTPEMGKLVADLCEDHNTILMANHGVVAWSHNNVEDAYFKMEILEAYCRTVLVASQLGKPPNSITPAQLQDLLKIKQSLGIPDPRFGLKECELCDNNEWRPGVTCAIPNHLNNGDQSIGPDAHAETLVEAITDQIMSRTK